MATKGIPVDNQRFSAFDTVLAAVGATLLIVTELLGAAFAFAWAVGGLLGVGDTGTWILMAVIGIPGLVASLALTRRILRVENLLRREPPSA
ncbi:hypothetical protein [Chthonobacter albigriseus]|uniref:hypothetical protein n=1 Tax=Chthonobacter albigriseus TaxID=1683161 RepID=UPI0015EE8EAE|nr:hypothetical protein [Chthonobacter albigriseus]